MRAEARAPRSVVHQRRDARARRAASAAGRSEARSRAPPPPALRGACARAGRARWPPAARAAAPARAPGARPSRCSSTPCSAARAARCPAGGQCTAWAGSSTGRPECSSLASRQASRTSLRPEARTARRRPRSPGSARARARARAASSSGPEPHTQPLGPHRLRRPQLRGLQQRARGGLGQLRPLPLHTCSTWPPGRTAQATSTPVRSSPVMRATRLTPSAAARGACRRGGRAELTGGCAP